MKNAVNQPHWLFQGAVILTIAGLLSKILSAVYRVPFQNIVGDTGFYIYQQVYPFLGIAIMLGTTGFPVMVSKLLSDHGEENRQIITRVSLVYITLLSLVLFLCLYIGAGRIASLMADSQLILLIQMSAFVFLFLPLTVMLRGVFQSDGMMLPTAVSQLVEQLIRVGVLLVLSFYFVKHGYSLYETGAGAVFSSIAGSAASLILLLFLWLTYRKQSSTRMAVKQATLRKKDVLKSLVLYTLTICVSGLLILWMQMIDAFHLYALLRSEGLSEAAAKAAKGVYDRGQPFLQLGTVFAISIGTSLVPFLSAAMRNGEHEVIRQKVRTSFKTTLVLGIGSAVGLICILSSVNTMLFRNDLGTDALQIFCISIAFTSIAITQAALLQGLGHTVYPAVVVLLSVLVKWILTLALVPLFGIYGAAWSTVCGFLAAALLNAVYLKHKGWISLRELFPVKILLSAAFMAIVLIGYQALFSWVIPFEKRPFSVLESLTSVFIGGFAFLYSILKLEVFMDEEWRLIPLGEKILYFKQMRGNQNGR
ncbi:putative polysaccharide biosynthesis protein [Bacillus pumilus]|uniref:putative polysaccharide biosynthesis protein n=1 Tax=Bacillus pumilus TaxID=1408 RepID=UPI0007761302|nr:polysaccharide biosynthesis protein [Bacillus pumilus]AMM95911.1 membrane protein [Bacillus pumilus]MDH3149889.1 polysaccharide biosynthesis protein [Bacillus pumilus]